MQQYSTTGAVDDEFQKLYLRKVTMEMQTDIEKLREAQDFNDSSVATLVAALGQGASLFSVDEQRTVMQAS